MDAARLGQADVRLGEPPIQFCKPPFLPGFTDHDPSGPLRVGARRRLIRGIDGYLLFPDNRILSRRVFSEIMTQAARHHVQVAVFNESLLKHGATFSASAVDTDIADTITIVLNEIENGNLAGVVPITPLSEIRIRTNPAMVRVFGLIVDSPEIDNPVADAQ